MKKTYIIPKARKIEAIVAKNLMAGSVGVNSGNTLGKEYNGQDQTYGRIMLYQAWE